MPEKSLEELHAEALRLHRLVQEGHALKISYSIAATAYAKRAAEDRRTLQPLKK